jgi:hypothetical protein
MKSQDLIAFIEIELVRLAIRHKGIQFDRFAAVLDGPAIDVFEKIFPNAL